MQTGQRFWQLIGFVFFILVVYGLMDLSDAIAARQVQLKNQQKLLFRQEALLRDNRWLENLRSAEQVRQAWMNYLPAEKSPTFAKARLLSDLRNLAKEAGIANPVVTATDAEGGDKINDKTAAGSATRAGARLGADKNKENTLPTGVQMIKLTVAGRFDPAAFNKLLQKQADMQRFSVLERVTVRGSQLELGIRSYWRVEPKAAIGGTTGKAMSEPVLSAVKGAL